MLLYRPDKVCRIILACGVLHNVAHRHGIPLDPSQFHNITLQGQYHCNQGSGVRLSQLCDFRTDCPLGDDEGKMCRAVFSVDGGQVKGHQGSALLRSPLFPPPLRNSPCEVRFWMCCGGGQKGALSLWLMKNSTKPEEQQRMWQSASAPKVERGWRLITVPLYGLVDWFWLQFRADHVPVPGSAICLDNISFSMDCFLASNGEFPPTETNTNKVPLKPTNQNIKTTTPSNGNSRTLSELPTLTDSAEAQLNVANNAT
ncbi:hypothetical protein DPEC_G00295050 [Dallia pectoralis]|uniref:Uncharacterized protein n=1 Tax=Dallia pectoralis TaxID=75939 RepID=A0ACC2FIN0_DALPE|nr:hypothetical protein DPEC_G00295050 [Dallia pectoralis]